MNSEFEKFMKWLPYYEDPCDLFDKIEEYFKGNDLISRDNLEFLLTECSVTSHMSFNRKYNLEIEEKEKRFEAIKKRLSGDIE